MLFKRLTIRDFLVFHGECRFDIPHEKEHNLVVFLAPQNTGKTSIVRSLKFLFYGEIPGGDLERYKLINRASLRQVLGMGAISGWVEATIEHDNREVTLRRTVRVSRRGEDDWSDGDTWLDEVKRGGETKFIRDQGSFQRMLNALVPRNLFDAFYFQGEPLEGKLLGGVGGIREHLREFLHEDKWAAAADAAREARRDFSSSLEMLHSKNKDYAQLIKDIEFQTNYLDNQKKALRDKKEKLERLDRDFDETNAELTTLGNPAEMEQLLQNRADAKARMDRAIRDREDAEIKLAALVGRTHGLPFITKAIDLAKKSLDEMTNKGLLPGDVTERIVEKVLRHTHCYCGTEHTDETRAAWKAYLNDALDADMSRNLSDLLNSIVGKRSRTTFANRVESNFQEIEDLKKDCKHAADARQEQEKIIKDIDAVLLNSPQDKIRTLGDRLTQLNRKGGELKREVGELESGISSAGIVLKKKKEEAEKRKPKGEVARKSDLFERARDRAEALANLIDKCREQLKDSYWCILQKLVAEAYNGRATDGSSAKIDYTTLLPQIVTRKGQVDTNLGGGQTQLLALAFVAGLAKLRKELHVQMRKLDIGLTHLDDQSFVMDSPFSGVDTYYSKAIADALRDGARQVMILVARQQWDLVREYIEKDIDVIWGMKQLSPGVVQDTDATLFNFQVGGKNVNLLKRVSETDADHTEIIHIKNG